MAMAQLAEWSFVTPEVLSSNPVIANFSNNINFTVNFRRDENEERIDRKCPILIQSI